MPFIYKDILISLPKTLEHVETNLFLYRHQYRLSLHFLFLSYLYRLPGRQGPLLRIKRKHPQMSKLGLLDKVNQLLEMTFSFTRITNNKACPQDRLREKLPNLLNNLHRLILRVSIHPG